MSKGGRWKVVFNQRGKSDNASVNSYSTALDHLMTQLFNVGDEVPVSATITNPFGRQFYLSDQPCQSKKNGKNTGIG